LKQQYNVDCLVVFTITVLSSIQQLTQQGKQNNTWLSSGHHWIIVATSGFSGYEARQMKIKFYHSVHSFPAAPYTLQSLKKLILSKLS